MSDTISLDEHEIAFLLSCPEALDALADYHDMQETMADAAGYPECGCHHESKSEQYRLWAQEARGRIELGI